VVNIKENISDPLPLYQVAPQGSVLGPLVFIIYTPLHSAPLYLNHLSNLISMPLTLNFLSLFLPSTSRSTSLISRLPSTMSRLGCQQTVSLSINLKLNSCLLVFLNNFPKFMILLFVYSLFFNLDRCQLDRLQHILNFAARAVSKNPRYSHISLILKSLHWLKIDQHMLFKILSLSYKTLQSQKPSDLYSLEPSQPSA